MATGCTVEIEPIGHDYDSLRSNPLLVDLFAANSSRLGRTMLHASDFPPEAAGSTDMGNVSWAVPSIHPLLALDCFPRSTISPSSPPRPLPNPGRARSATAPLPWHGP